VTKYFDTSVLVAALVQAERNHAACLRDLTSPVRKVTSAHALGELFATLTSGRLPLQFTPADAEKSIRVNILSSFEILTFTKADYSTAITKCGTVGARGGAFYDVLHLQAARISKPDEILTLNDRHFMTFAPDLASLIRRPN
jgi:predicted nucleic acid-binding protein